MPSPKIFISYSHFDMNDVIDGHERLKDSFDERKIWRDNKLVGGDVFSSEIYNEIINCEVFLCFLSAAWFISGACKKERDTALGENKIIISVIVRGDARAHLQNDDALNSRIWLDISESGWDGIHPSTRKKNFSYLVNSIKKQIPNIISEELTEKNEVDPDWIRLITKELVRIIKTFEVQDNPHIREFMWKVIAKPEAVRSLQDNHLQIGDVDIVDLIELYNWSEGKLLILGEKQCGKSMAVMDLLRILHKKLEPPYENHKVPIYLDFKKLKWNRRISFESWLIKNISELHKISEIDTELWVKENRFIYLLDNLDELKLSSRRDVVTKINEFLVGRVNSKVFHSVELVLCCRTQDYAEVGIKIGLINAYEVLQREGWIEYLYQRNADNNYQFLIDKLNANSEFQKIVLSKVPVFSKVEKQYKNVTKDEDPEDMILQNILQELVVDRLDQYDPQQVTESIRWLAQYMLKYNVKVFSINTVTPSQLGVEESYTRQSAITTGFIIFLSTFSLWSNNIKSSLFLLWFFISFAVVRIGVNFSIPFQEIPEWFKRYPPKTSKYLYEILNWLKAFPRSRKPPHVPKLIGIRLKRLRVHLRILLIFVLVGSVAGLNFVISDSIDPKQLGFLIIGGVTIFVWSWIASTLAFGFVRTLFVELNLCVFNKKLLNKLKYERMLRLGNLISLIISVLISGFVSLIALPIIISPRGDLPFFVQLNILTVALKINEFSLQWSQDKYLVFIIVWLCYGGFDFIQQLTFLNLLNRNRAKNRIPNDKILKAIAHKSIILTHNTENNSYKFFVDSEFVRRVYASDMINENSN